MKQQNEHAVIEAAAKFADDIKKFQEATGLQVKAMDISTDNITGEVSVILTTQLQKHGMSQ